MPLRRLAIWTLLALLATGSAHAGKPDWAGGGKEHGHGAPGHSKDQGEEAGPPAGAAIFFGTNERVAVRDYYAAPVGGGKCPPGLAKKNNGCLPPGQAKKWAIGHRLPRDVVYYELPPQLVLRLPPPPSGNRYVRVAGDVLLIATGSAMVVDAIQDLGRH
jgi:Ni/Co efflux regulator RcnB